MHYNLLSNYSGLRSLTDDTTAAITKAKSIRELVKGTNRRELQCEGIPEVLDKDRHKAVEGKCRSCLTFILISGRGWGVFKGKL